MYHGTIIQIDDCLVSEEILTEYFSCDYEKCKGCCCVIGDSGAPMEECEAGAIEKNYGIFSPLMREEGFPGMGIADFCGHLHRFCHVLDSHKIQIVTHQCVRPYLLPFPNHHFICLRPDLRHKHRMSHRKVQSLALSHRVMDNPFVLS